MKKRNFRVVKNITLGLVFIFFQTPLIAKDQSVIAQRIFIYRLHQITSQVVPAKASVILEKNILNKVQVSNKGSISGIVAGIDLAAIGNAAVYAWPADSVISDWTKGFAMVDSNFAYHIDSLSAGNYYVMAWAEGYMSQYYNNTDDPLLAKPVPVRENEITPNINFNLVKITPGTGSISGKVVSEKDHHPINQATVYVHSSDAPFFYGKAQTNEDGTYSIGELKSGDYNAEVYVDGYISEIYNDATSYSDAILIKVVEPFETPNIDFYVAPGGSISGIVMDKGGNPIAYASVEARSVISDSIGKNFSTSTSVSTDVRGIYSIKGLKEGNYFVRADYWGPWTGMSLWYPDVALPENAQPVVVQNEQDTPGIDFHFDIINPIGTIKGRVTNLAGQPIANATIQIQQSVYYPWDGTKWFSSYGITDEDGYYRIENIINGEYIVSCWAQSSWQSLYRYWPDVDTPELAKRILIDETNPNWMLDFNLPLILGTSSITGFVYTKDGKPLYGAYIQLSPDNTNSPEFPNRPSLWAYAYSDSSGFYGIKSLSEGKYVISSSCWQNQSFGQQWYKDADSLSFATVITLQINENRKDIDFHLTLRPMYGAVIGIVTDAQNGQPISRAYIEIKHTMQKSNVGYRPIAWFPYFATTDDLGQYRFDWLPEGEYLLSVHANGAFAYYPDAVVPQLATAVKVIGGEKTAADFNLQTRNEGSGIITGNVAEEYFIRPMEGGFINGVSKDSLITVYNALEIAVVTAKPAISILSWPQSEMFFSAVTDKEGNYALNGLPIGDYYVMSFAPGFMMQYYDQTFDPSQAKLIHVNGIDKVTEIKFKLNPLRFMYYDAPNKEGNFSNGVTGRITDEKNQPLVNAVIYLLNESGTPVSYTNSDANGKYELNSIPPGNYYLQTSKIGYSTTFNGNAEKREQTNSFTLVNGVMIVNIIAKPENKTNVNKQETVEKFELYGNYPNPFNPETSIKFKLLKPMHISLRVINTLGQEVKTLFIGTLPEGSHNIKWDGSDQNGLLVCSGLYFYRFESESLTKSGKMLYMK